MTLKCFISGWSLKGKTEEVTCRKMEGKRCRAERETCVRVATDCAVVVMSFLWYWIVNCFASYRALNYVYLWLFTADGACFFVCFFPLQSELAVLAKLPPLSERRLSFPCADDSGDRRCEELQRKLQVLAHFQGWSFLLLAAHHCCAATDWETRKGLPLGRSCFHFTPEGTVSSGAPTLKRANKPKCNLKQRVHSG